MTTSKARKRLRGTLRADRQRPPDPAGALAALPPAPPGLPSAAAAAWLRFGRLACDLGTLTPADLPLLELLARTWASATDLEHQLAADGPVLESESGAKKAHPALAALNQTRALAHRLLADFGLSPPGRERISLPPKTKSNPFVEV